MKKGYMMKYQRVENGGDSVRSRKEQQQQQQPDARSHSVSWWRAESRAGPRMFESGLPPSLYVYWLGGVRCVRLGARDVEESVKSGRVGDLKGGQKGPNWTGLAEQLPDRAITPGQGEDLGLTRR
ncbi:unnamed protein product [Pleuronectes platessa]|uniref:Uncharacterized protein n=1 Tax=Pleuronectes platessa TaxID=8262 RepID=A0A9N7UNN2_PLEPL|nr:unnamed protein product [Pleuronectes platessa]